MIKVIELFAGIGAQCQALKEAGVEHQVIAISEIDQYAEKVYNTIHGDTLNLGDISKIEKLPKADFWTYSYPCTDISLAGKQRGLEKGSGTCSSLLWEVQRLLEVSKEANELPKYLLLENVKNQVGKKFKPYFDTWCQYLESLGYKNFYKVLDAQNYGVPQHRERLYMISIRDENATYEFPKPFPLKVYLKDLLEKEVDEKYYLSQAMINCCMDTKNRNGIIRLKMFKPHEKDKNDVAWTLCTSGGSRANDNFIVEEIKPKIIISDDTNEVVVPENTKQGYKIAEEGDGIYVNRPFQKRGVVQRGKIPTLKTSVNDIGVVVKDNYELINIRKITPRESWRLMGWKDEDIDLAFSIGVSNTQLYKQAGNSIVVNVLTEIFKNVDFKGE